MKYITLKDKIQICYYRNMYSYVSDAGLMEIIRNLRKKGRIFNLSPPRAKIHIKIVKIVAYRELIKRRGKCVLNHTLHSQRLQP
jgi:hypothetical protein